MLAWQKLGKGETPQNSGIKGDHLVGKYYVEFDRILQLERKPLLDKVLAGDLSFISSKHLETAQKLKEKYILHQDEDALSALKKLVDNYTPALQEAQQLLRLWEAGDKHTLQLWKTMNGWVYEGFDITYTRMGVSFDKVYYESDTYLLGKELVQEGLHNGCFYTKEDGSIWVDLSELGLDHKLLQRSDGTSVYITQDMGTAELKYKDFNMDKSIYVVGNEQDYHFKVLQLILQKMGKPHADGIFHFSYGMVDLPSGRMKSREGTVVDADDLMDEMITEARLQTEALGKTEGFSKEELQKLYTTIGLGALKFYLLRVEPKKRILFDPKESIDLHGYTGPFVQYTYARIQSLLRRASQDNITIKVHSDYSMHICEKELLLRLYEYSTVLQEAAAEFNPSKIIDYAYELAKLYNKFYAEVSIFQSETREISFRLAISLATGNLLKTCFNMMGIDVPERM
jgi:arginyl-tRNA synthetase